MAEPSVKLMRSCDQQELTTFKSWSKTQSSVVKIEHVWVIENLSLLPVKKYEFLEDPYFADENQTNEEIKKWRLRLFPKGFEDVGDKHKIVFLELKTLKKISHLVVNCKIVAMNNKQDVIEQIEYQAKKVFKERTNLLLIIQKDLSKPCHLPSDELNIKIELSYIASRRTSFSSSSSL